jgi:hypothetical protein
LNWPNDYIEIRLADTYLMEAEADLNGGGIRDVRKLYLMLYVPVLVYHLYLLRFKTSMMKEAP